MYEKPHVLHRKRIPEVRVKESEALYAICGYLEAKRHMFWRQNTASIFREGRYFSMPAHSMKGVPDIILIKDGQFVGIEVKGSHGAQSPEQKEFQTNCEKAGGRYHIARTIEDIQALGL